MANDNLHFEKPNLSIFLIFKRFLEIVFSKSSFSPIIARSASPLFTKEGISSSLTKRISIGIVLDLIYNLPSLDLNLTPDFCKIFWLSSDNLPFFCIAIVNLLFIFLIF